MYNHFTKNNGRPGKKNTLTYDEFIEFTKTEKCHYCNIKIKWVEYGNSVMNKDGPRRSYFLDRKDTHSGYSKQNCVVACTLCNWTRSKRFTYEEFKMLSPVLEQIRLSRGDL